MNDAPIYKFKNSYQCPGPIMLHPKLTHHQKDIFNLLWGFLGFGKECWYSNDKLMKLTNCKKSKLNESILGLEHEAIIMRIGCGSRRKFVLGTYMDQFLNKEQPDKEQNRSPANNNQIEPKQYRPPACEEQLVEELITDKHEDEMERKTSQIEYDLVANDDESLAESSTKIIPVSANSEPSFRVCGNHTIYNKINNKQQQTKAPSSNSKTDSLETPTLEPVVVLENWEKELIAFKDRLPTSKKPDLENHDFLSAAREHIDNLMQINFAKTHLHGINCLKKVLTDGWSIPSHYKTKTQLRSEKANKEALEQRLRDIEASSRAKANIAPEHRKADLSSLCSLLGLKSKGMPGRAKEAPQAANDDEPTPMTPMTNMNELNAVLRGFSHNDKRRVIAGE